MQSTMTTLMDGSTKPAKTCNEVRERIYLDSKNHRVFIAADDAADFVASMLQFEDQMAKYETVIDDILYVRLLQTDNPQEMN